ncbi:hypothetical protein ACVIRO_001033 [Rhizobium ruizarguesonis]
MANQSGIAIIIKAFLPTGKTLDEQLTALTLVKEAHSSSDYTALLKAAEIEDVKTEQKTRRVEIPATTVQTNTETTTGGDDASGLKAAFDGVSPVGGIDSGEAAGAEGGEQNEGEDSGAEVPAFLKPKRRTAA